MGKITDTKPVELKLPGIEKGSNLWRYWMTLEPNEEDAILGEGNQISPIVELGKKLIGQSHFSIGAILPMLDNYLPTEDAVKMRQMTKQIYEELEVI